VSSNRRSFFKTALATGLVLLTGRVRAKPKPLIQYFEYGWNAKTETIPVTFEEHDGNGMRTNVYRITVHTPEPRLVIRYSDGTQAVFVGDEVGCGLELLEQSGIEK